MSLVGRAGRGWAAIETHPSHTLLPGANTSSRATRAAGPDPGHVALGSWSGGRYVRFGVPVDEDRLAALLRPGGGIHTVLTADVYGEGGADALVGRALAGLPRDYALVGAVGHDFVGGARDGAKGFPRFTDSRLRGPDGYAGYLRGAVERSLERCRTDRLDVLLLHNPDRIGYSSEVVWRALADLRDEGLTGALGVAPGGPPTASRSTSSRASSASEQRSTGR